MTKRILLVLVLLAAVVAAPLLLRRDTRVAEIGEAQDRIVILTPHNDSIRSEFGEAFAAYWQEEAGRSIHVDWRAPGGGGEIDRLITGSFAAAEELGKEGTEYDVFFGGGAKDFMRQASAGRLAPLSVFRDRPEWFTEDRIPATFSGEPYFDPDHRWVGVCVSQFGIVYNRDRIARLGLSAPEHWTDLGSPSYFGTLALADPTKSSSVTQAFEMIVQEQMQAVIRRKGDSPSAREEGWKRGLNVLQDLAANARYFTDSSSKIPYDVATGNAAAGTAIDFYGRSFEDSVRGTDGVSRIRWIAPRGGTSLSVDPVAVFRGAPHAEIAQAFVTFCLSDRGQLLWNLRPGVPGGPKARGLRRLPVRRDLYVPEHLKDFTDPDALPFERTGDFVYRPELTRDAFNALRLVFRTMCMDPHDELKDAWERAVLGREDGLAEFHDTGPLGYAEVMDGLVPLLQRNDALEIARESNRISTWFRDHYRSVAKGGRP